MSFLSRAFRRRDRSAPDVAGAAAATPVSDDSDTSRGRIVHRPALGRPALGRAGAVAAPPTDPDWPWSGAAAAGALRDASPPIASPAVAAGCAARLGSGDLVQRAARAHDRRHRRRGLYEVQRADQAHLGAADQRPEHPRGDQAAGRGQLPDHRFGHTCGGGCQLRQRRRCPFGHQHPRAPVARPSARNRNQHPARLVRRHPGVQEGRRYDLPRPSGAVQLCVLRGRPDLHCGDGAEAHRYRDHSLSGGRLRRVRQHGQRNWHGDDLQPAERVSTRPAGCA